MGENAPNFDIATLIKMLGERDAILGEKDAIIKNLSASVELLTNEVANLKTVIMKRYKEQPDSEAESVTSHSNSMSTEGTENTVNTESSVRSNASNSTMRPKKRKLTKSIPLSNRFAALITDEQEVDQQIPQNDDVILPAWVTKPVAPVPQPPKVRRPPPIVLANSNNFKTVNETLKLNTIVPSNIIMRPKGIQIFTENVDDFRGTRKVLDALKEGYHTFQLQEEKELKVVLRGVPECIDEDEIENDLAAQGFKFNNVKRLGNKDRKFPLVLVNAPKNEEGKKLFEVNKVCQVKVATEPKRRSSRTQQCFRCQKHGHVQFRCTAEYRCCKCAASHPSWNCNLPKESTPKCVNCNGPHPSMAFACPANPDNMKKQKEINDQVKRQRVAAATRTNLSYADKIKGVVNNSVNNSDTADITTKVMEAMMRLLPQIIDSIKNVK